MKEVWLISDSIVSPLGHSTVNNFQALQAGKSGIRKLMTGVGEVYASGWDKDSFKTIQKKGYTRFESLAVTAIESAVDTLPLDIESKRLAVVFSTTKGNIDLALNSLNADECSLPRAAQNVIRALGWTKIASQPIIVSNACVSGLTAVQTAKRLLERENYDHVVIVGCDILSDFVVSGFRSLSAMSDEPCKPFDKNRKGISLGEAAACCVLTNNAKLLNSSPCIKIAGMASTNDANHISGPSRTGKELADAITFALKESGTHINDVGFISAHGTATLYNDEMEAKAINLLSMEHVPVNSLKGYFGHTLGAAGLLEMIISAHMLKSNELVASYGYDEHGVSLPLNVIKSRTSKHMKKCLKTASGFGGGNAALVLEKV